MSDEPDAAPEQDAATSAARSGWGAAASRARGAIAGTRDLAPRHVVPAATLLLALTMLVVGGWVSALGGWILTVGFSVAVGAWWRGLAALAAPPAAWLTWVVAAAAIGPSVPQTPVFLALLLSILGIAGVLVAQRTVAPALEARGAPKADASTASGPPGPRLPRTDPETGNEDATSAPGAAADGSVDELDVADWLDLDDDPGEDDPDQEGLGERDPDQDEPDRTDPDQDEPDRKAPDQDEPDREDPDQDDDETEPPARSTDGGEDAAEPEAVPASGHEPASDAAADPQATASAEPAPVPDGDAVDEPPEPIRRAEEAARAVDADGFAIEFEAIRLDDVDDPPDGGSDAGGTGEPGPDEPEPTREMERHPPDADDRGEESRSEDASS